MFKRDDNFCQGLLSKNALPVLEINDAQSTACFLSKVVTSSQSDETNKEILKC